METTLLDAVKAGNIFMVYILHLFVIRYRSLLLYSLVPVKSDSQNSGKSESKNGLCKLKLLFVNEHFDPRSIQIHSLNVTKHGGSSGFLANVMMI
jgi:hypothetical protein